MLAAMAVVLRDAPVIYLAHQYTASNATVDALSTLGVRHSAGHHDTLEDVVAQGLLGDAARSSYTVCTAIRNPFDVLVTWWRRHAGDRSLREFLLVASTLEPSSEVGEAPSGLITPFRGDRIFWLHAADADVVLRYEALGPDLNAVLARHGLGPVTIPTRNVTPDRARDHRAYYDDETRRLVEALFEHELREYGYSFDPRP